MDKGYPQMGYYLNQTNRPMVYSCSWPAYQNGAKIEPNYNLIAQYCNLWRNWDDIDDSFDSLLSITEWLVIVSNILEYRVNNSIFFSGLLLNKILLQWCMDQANGTLNPTKICLLD